MSQETINKSLQKNLISPLTHDLLWSQFLHAFSYELENLKEKYGSIKNNWNIENNDIDNLIRISESFGYTPNLIINNTINMAKLEIESIPYRMRRKTTYDGYSLILKQNGSKGEVFNYYWNNYKLIKVVNWEATDTNLFNSDHYSPFCGLVGVKNYSNYVNESIMHLDSYDKMGVIEFRLDTPLVTGNSVWQLDKSYIYVPTKHIGLEYFPQTYYCSYRTSLGIAYEDEKVYETQIQSPNYYVQGSMKIEINGKPLDISISYADSKEIYTDDLGILSESYFDIKSNLVHLTFNTVPTDCEISIEYGINLLITSDYFYYLEKGTEYNRRCPIVPHHGICLTADISQSRGSDFYYPNEGNYTVPDLKLKAITSSAYNRYINLTDGSILDNDKDSEGQPSGKENFKLDSEIKWFLDTSATLRTSLTDNFKYISCGNKALNVINEKNNEIFNPNKIIFYYNLNGDDYDSTLLDISVNRINCNIIGDKVKIDSVIDKSLNFNGDTYAYSDSHLNLSQSNTYSLGMWFKVNDTEDTSVRTLFDSFINISYDYQHQKLLINSNEYNCSTNEYHFLYLEYDGSSSKASVYIDGEFEEEINLTILASSLIFIGTDENEELNFYGEIDNLWLLSKIITEEQLHYIYDNKISVISHMGNRLARYELSTDDEVHEGDNYTMIQSYIKAMDINEEHVLLTENADESQIFTHQTKFYPITPSYFNMTYTNTSNKLVTIQSNLKGEFYNKEDGEIVSGGIDFKNGTWNLLKNTIKSITQEEVTKPKEDDNPTSYKVTTKSTESEKWYEHKINNNEYSDEITADRYDVSSATLNDTLIQYVSNKDISNRFIYTRNKETYYVLKNESLIDDESNEIEIKSFVSNVDDSETCLFSSDNGNTLYFRLNDLVDDLNNTEDENRPNSIKAFSDLGELTGTTLYKTNDDSTVYLTINSLYNEDVNMVVRKWKLNNNDTIGYTLGNINTEFSQNKYYSNLSFTSELIVTSKNEELSFNPFYTTIRCTEIDLSSTLDEQKTIEKYSNMKSITDVKNFDYILKKADYEIVKNPDVFILNYWVKDEDEGIMKKKSVSVSKEGYLIADDIEYGRFDYTNKKLSVTFRDKITSNIVISYDYYYSLDIDYTKLINMNYKTEKSVKINEVGLEDENHELMAYMTFPDVEFNSMYDHLSALFAISKS
jgi:endogenous inhibitor of DNA gyrase (YacG/DUF329 family)